MPQIAVSIVLSDRAAHIAVTEARFRHARLAAVDTVSFVAEASMEQRWQEVRERLPARIDSLAINLDAAAVSSRRLTFPFGDMRKVESALAYELEGQIPFNIEDVAVSWFPITRGPRQTDLVAALAPREAVTERIATLAAGQLEPRIVAHPAAGLAELVAEPGDDMVAILSLGSRASHLAVVGRRPHYVRTLRTGGDDIDNALAQTLRVSLPEARRIKESEAAIVSDEGASEDARAISDAVCAGLAPLVAAMGATLRTLDPEELPTRMLLTGGTSRLRGLVDYLSRVFAMPVMLLDIKGSLGEMEAPERLAPEDALVVGLALGQLRHGHNALLNFRRGDLAYEGDIQLYRGQLTRIAVGLAAVILLAITTSSVRYMVMSSEEQRLNEGFCQATEKIVGRCIADPTAALSIMRQSPGATQGGVAIPSYSAATLYEMLSRVLGTDVDVSFDELDFHLELGSGGTDRITGKGDAASFDTTEKVVSDLKKDACVSEAEVSKQRKKRDSTRVEFSLQVKVSCPPGVLPGESAPSPMAPGDSGPAAPTLAPATKDIGPKPAEGR